MQYDHCFYWKLVLFGNSNCMCDTTDKRQQKEVFYFVSNSAAVTNALEVREPLAKIIFLITTFRDDLTLRLNWFQHKEAGSGR